MKKLTARDMVQIALVAAIYIALTITPPFNAISFGAYQFRISEMMNFMAFYNRKYIIGVTIGCMISNFFSFGILDVFLTLGVVLFSKVKPGYLLNGWLRKDFFLFSIFFSISMVTIAIELNIVTGAPFLLTWFTTAIGECASLLVGAILIDKISKRIDLTQ